MNTINWFEVKFRVSLMLADKMYISKDAMMLSLFRESNFPIEEGIKCINEDRCFVVMRNEDPVGYCINNNGLIEKLYLHLEYKGMGIAKELIKKALENTPEKIDENLEKYKDYDFYIKPV